MREKILKNLEAINSLDSSELMIGLDFRPIRRAFEDILEFSDEEIIAGFEDSDIDLDEDLLFYERVVAEVKKKVGEGKARLCFFPPHLLN